MSTLDKMVAKRASDVARSKVVENELQMRGLSVSADTWGQVSVPLETFESLLGITSVSDSPVDERKAPLFSLLGQVREQVEEIASAVGAAALPSAPVRIDDTGRISRRVWGAVDDYQVHTTPHPDGERTVFLLDERNRGDWSALTLAEARELGTALLAAAADAAKAPEIKHDVVKNRSVKDTPNTVFPRDRETTRDASSAQPSSTTPDGTEILPR